MLRIDYEQDGGAVVKEAELGEVVDLETKMGKMKAADRWVIAKKC